MSYMGPIEVGMHFTDDRFEDLATRKIVDIEGETVFCQCVYKDGVEGPVFPAHEHSVRTHWSHVEDPTERVDEDEDEDEGAMLVDEEGLLEEEIFGVGDQYLLRRPLADGSHKRVFVCAIDTKTDMIDYNLARYEDADYTDPTVHSSTIWWARKNWMQFKECGVVLDTRTHADGPPLWKGPIERDMTFAWVDTWRPATGCLKPYYPIIFKVAQILPKHGQVRVHMWDPSDDISLEGPFGGHSVVMPIAVLNRRAVPI